MNFEFSSFEGNYTEKDIGRMGPHHPQDFEAVVIYLQKCQTMLESENITAVQKRFIFFCMFDATRHMLGRAYPEIIQKETQKRVKALGSQVPPFETRRGRSAPDVFDFIHSHVDPLLDPDMKEESTKTNVWSHLNPRAGKGNKRKSLYQAVLNKNQRNYP